MLKRLLYVLLALLLIAVALWRFYPPARQVVSRVRSGLTPAQPQDLRDPSAVPVDFPFGRATVEDRLSQCGRQARARLAPHFRQAGVAYPPKELVLVGVKDTWQLEVWARSDSRGPMHRVMSYPVLGHSGVLGPKLREGDGQVPEGVYRVESLNPNSSYHLSVRVGYPSDFDRRMGAADGRRKLGGDIMIHGSNCSIGCLAMGDVAAEELFVLAADTKLENTTVILTPVDFRVRDLPRDMPATPNWYGELCGKIRAELGRVK